MIDHRIHVAGTDREKQTWPAKLPPWVATAPIGLAENSYSEAGILEHSVQYGHGKARVIDVGITRDKHHIDSVPTTLAHLFSIGWSVRAGMGLMPLCQTHAFRFATRHGIHLHKHPARILISVTDICQRGGDGLAVGLVLNRPAHVKIVSS